MLFMFEKVPQDLLPFSGDNNNCLRPAFFWNNVTYFVSHKKRKTMIYVVVGYIEQITVCFFDELIEVLESAPGR